MANIREKAISIMAGKLNSVILLQLYGCIFFIFIGAEKYASFGAICSIQNGSGISYATPPNGDWVTVKTRLN